MMRRSSVQLFVSWHPIIPGKPAVRGLLYRPSHMNMYSRLGMLAAEQRTEEEGRITKYISSPEVFCTAPLAGLLLAYWVYIFMFDTEMSMRMDKLKRTNFEGMDNEEVFARNWEMAQIFQQHRELVAETRKKYCPERPEVFDPPAGHVAWYDPAAPQPRHVH
jgi:hypothetical protein